jgi:hypothetical protein
MRKRPSDSNVPGAGIGVALGWYSLRDWQELKRVADDPESLHKTYIEWVEEAEKTIRTLGEAGTVVTTLPVDVAELQSWCEANGVKNTGASRARFIAEKNQERGRRF